jgi:hypothetical protein
MIPSEAKSRPRKTAFVPRGVLYRAATATGAGVIPLVALGGLSSFFEIGCVAASCFCDGSESGPTCCPGPVSEAGQDAVDHGDHGDGEDISNGLDGGTDGGHVDGNFDTPDGH